jgi:hypothetical protein
MQTAGFKLAEKRAKRQKLNPKNDKFIDLDDINISQRDWGHIKRWVQDLRTSYILLSSLGKITVVTAHQKDLFDDPNSEKKKKIGEIPDIAKKAEYDFDLVIQLYTVGDGEDVEYFGKILKDRTGVTKKGQSVKNPSFDMWKAKWESTKKHGIKEALDLSEGINKDFESMSSDEDKIDELLSEFKSKIKALDKDSQPKVMKEAKRLGIDNPLKSDNIKGMTQLIKFIDNLEIKV